MYNDEWKPVMTADTVEEQIEAFVQPAQKRVDKQV